MEKIYYYYQVLLKLLFINDIFSFIFTVTYPHTIPDYKPVMVDYEQIDFSNGVDYAKSLGFVIIDPNNREFLHKICACKTVYFISLIYFYLT
jgi:hypothetical protein